MRTWILLLLLAIFVSCSQTREVGEKDQKVQTYIDVLKQSLDLDTLQQYFYRYPDGSSYPLTVVDEVLSSRVNKPIIEKFGHPVTFLSKDAADSAGLESYFWVIDYQQHGDDARIQLEDPIRHVLFGASYSRTTSGWHLESVYLDQSN